MHRCCRGASRSCHARAPFLQMLDCVCHTQLLTVLFTFVSLPHMPQLSQLAIVILSRMLLDLSPDVVDAAIGSGRQTSTGPGADAPPSGGSSRSAPPQPQLGIDESQAGGRTVRFLTDVAGGVLPVSSTEPLTSELAIPALQILRAMHLHPPQGSPWKEVVGAFVAAHLSKFPNVTSMSALYHDDVRYYCIALHILTGCPDTLRVGSEVIYAAPNAVTERMVVLHCDFAKGKAVCISGEDVSMMSEEKEVRCGLVQIWHRSRD